MLDMQKSSSHRYPTLPAYLPKKPRYYFDRSPMTYFLFWVVPIIYTSNSTLCPSPYGAVLAFFLNARVAFPMAAGPALPTRNGSPNWTAHPETEQKNSGSHLDMVPVYSSTFINHRRYWNFIFQNPLPARCMGQKRERRATLILV